MTDHGRVRGLDIVVHGATGFVGALVAGYLAAHAPDGVRIALAGRSAARLEAVRARLGRDWPVIVADAGDAAALRELAAATHVVIAAAGPYSKYGRLLVGACAAAGTDYVDLTGEIAFTRASADDNHDLARSTGARIVHSCGFDSVPSDLGVHALYSRARADGAGDLTGTTLVVTSIRGGVSGGTIDSFRHQLDLVIADRGLRRLFTDPYSLSPAPEREPDLGAQPDLAVLRGRDVDPSLGGCLAPFVFAPHNARVVRRSNALLGWAYGRRFRYREAMSVGGPWLSPALAAGVKLMVGAFVAAMAVPPTRFVLDRILPRPGRGPGERALRSGYFTVDVFATTTSGARYRATVHADADPGYAVTSVMISEAALALVLDRAELPALGGGVLTPATGIGDPLVRRLRAAGVDISARATGRRLPAPDRT